MQWGFKTRCRPQANRVSGVDPVSWTPHRMCRPLGSVLDAYDNAMVEGFFAALERDGVIGKIDKAASRQRARIMTG